MSTTVLEQPRPAPWPEPWAVQASVEAARIQHRLNAAPTARVREFAASKAAVEYHLAEVRDACRCTTRFKRRDLRDQWRGTSIERAYMHLHAAKIFLTDLLPDAEFEAVVPEVTTRLATVLDRNDPRRVEAEGLLRSTKQGQRRAALKHAMETAYDASDEEYMRLRDFRNIILITAAAIALVTGILVAVVAFSPAAIPLCFEPGVTSAATDQQPVQQVQTVCPSGDHQSPTGGDILIVAGLGAVGGALGAIVAIRNLRGTSTPYSVSTALAVLKVPAGALSAVIGMLLVSGGFVPGLTNLDNQRQILAYALVFGIAQQLVTRVADSRAQQILDHLPSKDPQAKSAEAPVQAPTAPQDGPGDGTVPDVKTLSSRSDGRTSIRTEDGEIPKGDAGTTLTAEATSPSQLQAEQSVDAHQPSGQEPTPDNAGSETPENAEHDSAENNRTS